MSASVPCVLFLGRGDAVRVLFCPYCAGMWRSLEPLFKQEKKAGHDVRTMPLPYYVRDLSGECREKKNDGPLFPTGINLVYDMDIAEWHPDRIYIHNSYDGGNRITCVDPAYWSEKLRACTDELVYVPYYTIADGDIESALRAPGVHNADRIIVWSEAQAANFYRHVEPWRVYVRQRPKPRKKKIPAEWAGKINGRRVILVNNSIGSLIASPDRELKKLAHLFTEHRSTGDCILWRPHPLFLATIRAMFPMYEREYMALFDRFPDDWILDETWDVDRAIQAADEYLGDHSSLVYAFRETGKPIKII